MVTGAPNDPTPQEVDRFLEDGRADKRARLVDEPPEVPGTEGGYRKPSPRFIEEASALMGISTRSCHVIGDTLVDLQTAWAAHANAWAVNCGKPELPRAIADRAVQGEYSVQDSFLIFTSKLLPDSADRIRS